MAESHRDVRSGDAWTPLDEHATFRLGINYGLRSAFTVGAPMSQQEYEWRYFHTPSGAYFAAPSYEEYLRLYDRYSETCRVRATGVSDREAAERVIGLVEQKE
jgi:hypothetical protein